ncbi:hypothetical protein CLV30_12823 [Haloactinopolyspora alba]|uniref:Uncharacterized protein n=1 Tax=Haloactinopolyspora alba TaxID=648780 RepID=A0A2P8DEY4_9ACTN|nr:hypothetical protein [Haloactinopolyspora alba]PSK95771.1 hypothetical protein CLV30_12823 [Haloactinopolyspora alba]
MTVAELAEFWVHRVTVEPYEGEGAYGPIYGAPVADVACYVENRRQLVRDRTGAEVVSDTTIYAPVERAGLFPPGSRVALPDHTPVAATLVISTSPLTSGGLGLPDHVVIACK